ncbi:NAD(P)H-dependent glycerol-3-phosphate dehydrogenase [Persicirhabdus sediminis]|uniref:Glycerol-3-phosphate dehydrogenase [NAD(P)+] n=1 Tax=Persicirhabdus sediminis TaxID=454144 RepID=A0A8J7SHY8_9BACT|nr:NAD(P)H-dependent glycerol-3-phosphate dehydrogenase [Persicirhabdus sediminis]MBK1790169.1 NAD(P)-dependent glycerol-3-phosphate dehydrogenase [Persicirhabdus sediminis]
MTIDRTTAGIVGTGSWGSGLASLLAGNFKQINMIGNHQETVDEINEQHTNKHFLPALTLPENVHAFMDLEALKECSIVLVVIPTSGVRATAANIARLGLAKETVIISCSKGIEHATGDRMSSVLKEFLPDNPIAVLSGPNHAEEVSQQLATCAVIGAEDEALALELQKIFSASYFRTYTSDDLAGIELGGAIKNVFAISAGIADGLGLGDNAIAALVARGLAEMTRLGVALGGRTETFMGLSGIGDLMVTCYSSHSRNNRVGKALGRGGKLDDIVNSLGMVAEGVPNTKSIYEAARKANVRTPLIDAVYDILYNDKSSQEAMHELLNGDMRSEIE